MKLTFSWKARFMSPHQIHLESHYILGTRNKRINCHIVLALFLCSKTKLFLLPLITADSWPIICMKPFIRYLLKHNVLQRMLVRITQSSRGWLQQIYVSSRLFFFFNLCLDENIYKPKHCNWNPNSIHDFMGKIQ